MTGAALAWMAARRAVKTIVVSLDRPASQATALASGVVHGFGPPGGWSALDRATDRQLAAAAERGERGHEALRELLLEAGRPSDYTMVSHRIELPRDVRARAEAVVARMGQAGLFVRLESGPEGLQLVRPFDAVLRVRRLTFELLRGARLRGAQVRLGTRIAAFERGSPTGTRVIWAGGRPWSHAPGEAGLRERLVLHQRFASGSRALDAVLSSPDGELMLLPEPGGAVAMIRAAEEAPSGGLSWPEPPTEWWEHCGLARRQRLAEALFATEVEPVVEKDAVTSIAGLGGWPLTQTLGLCSELVERWS